MNGDPQCEEEISMGQTANDGAIAPSTNLDPLALDMLRFVYRRLEGSKRPKSVPLMMLVNAMKEKYGKKEVSYKKIRGRMDKIVRIGLLKKWVNKHPTQYKIAWYALPPNFFILLEKYLPPKKSS